MGRHHYFLLLRERKRKMTLLLRLLLCCLTLVLTRIRPVLVTHCLTVIRKKNVTCISFHVSSCNCTSFRKTNSHGLLHLHHLRNCTWFKLSQHATVWKTCRQQVNKYKKRREKSCFGFVTNFLQTCI